MMTVDWTALVLGLAVGAATSALFFAGLAVGMRLALRAGNAVPVLLLSALLRISALLGLGWLVAAKGGVWAFAGYAAAFLLVRLVATVLARAGAPVGGGR